MNTRRNFLRSSLRCGGLIALGGTATLLAWRTVQGGCVRNNPCGECPLLRGCDLEKSRDTRKSTSQHHSDHV